MAICASGNYVGGALWPKIVRGADPRLRLADGLPGRRRDHPGRHAAVLPGAAARSPAHGGGAAAAAPHSAQALGLSPTALQVWLGIAGIGCCVAMAMPQVHIVAYCVDLGYGAARGAEMLSLMTGARHREPARVGLDRRQGRRHPHLAARLDRCRRSRCRLSRVRTDWSRSTSCRPCSACSRAASSRPTA